MSLGQKSKEFGELLFSFLLDSIFIAIWGLGQWAVDALMNTATFNEIDAWMLNGFQIVLAIASFFPVAMLTYRDIRILWIKIVKQIDEERVN